MCAGIVQSSYKHFCQQILQVHKSSFTETYLVSISDRERSDSQERSKIGDRTESGSHSSQTIALSLQHFTKSASCRYSAVSGPATGTSHTLTVTVHTPTLKGKDVCRHKISSHHERIDIAKQQLHPLNCPNYRLVGIVPFTFPSRFPLPAFPVALKLELMKYLLTT